MVVPSTTAYLRGALGGSPGVEQLPGHEGFDRGRNGLAPEEEQQCCAPDPTLTARRSDHREPRSTHRKLVAARGSPAPSYSATFGYAQSSLEPLGLASGSSQWALYLIRCRIGFDPRVDLIEEVHIGGPDASRAVVDTRHHEETHVFSRRGVVRQDRVVVGDRSERGDRHVRPSRVHEQLATPAGETPRDLGRSR